VRDSRSHDPVTAIAFFAVLDGAVSEVTDWWPEPFDPPPGREHLAERE
jgi:hypothetical protein